MDQHRATQYSTWERLWTPSYSVSFQPFYLPWEFGQITLPTPNDMAAGERIMESYRKALARSVYQPVFVLGDFISCNLSNQLPNLHQYVDCPTCLIRMLDHCYGNMSEAHKAVCRPPLGKSDHNVIHLLPKYKAVVKRMNLMPNKFSGVLRKVGNKSVICLKTLFDSKHLPT